jgi:hypothetical protein
MQRTLMAVVILYLVGTSIAMADEPCRTKARTIVSRSLDALKQAVDLLIDGDFAAIDVLHTRGTITLVEAGTEIYVKEARGESLYHVRLRGLPDVLWAVTFGGFDCPTPAPADPSPAKRSTKKPKRP